MKRWMDGRVIFGSVVMGGWIDGWMGSWIDGWMGSWIDGWIG